MTAPRILELDDPDYPAALRNLPRPPPTLYVQGRLELLERPGIAVVGTRSHTTYGRDATVSLVLGLARAVLVVEAPERSGALITARYALDEGKEIFAVPGPIHNRTGSSRAPL